MKSLHLLLVVAVFGVHFLKGLWLLQNFPSPDERWMRFVHPMLIAAVMLSGLWMLVQFGWNMGRMPWLISIAINSAIFLYLSFLAFFSRFSHAIRTVCWVASLPVFINIVVIEMLTDPSGLVGLYRWAALHT